MKSIEVRRNITEYETYSNVLQYATFHLPIINNQNFRAELQMKPIVLSQIIYAANKLPLVNDPIQNHLALTLMMASAERYSVGIVEKEMLSAFKKAKAIGDELGLPPCLLTSTYYLENSKRITFTANPGEIAFIDISERVTSELRSANEALLQFSGNETELLDIARRKLEGVRELYLSFRDRLDPDFFAGELRGYSKPMKVDGITYPSKSIASNAEDMKLNLLLGWPEKLYLQHIESRWEGLSGQDRDGVLLARKRLEERRTVRDLLNLQNKEAIRSFIRLSKQNGQNAATHRFLIVQNIDKPHIKAKEEGRPISVPVGRYGDKGLGGLYLDEVEHFRQMRFETNPDIPILEKLL